MKLLFRLFLAIVIPPAVGLASFLLIMSNVSDVPNFSFSMAKLLDDLPFMMLASLALSFIPSLIAFALFEFVISKQLKSFVEYVVVGIMFGYVSTLFIHFLIVRHVWVFHAIHVSGGFVGLVLAVMYYWLKPPAANSKLNNTNNY